MDRANLLIYEEARLLKKGIIDSVFEKMAYPRQAMYMQDEKYAKNPRWQEQAKSVYITSARFKSEWLNFLDRAHSNMSRKYCIELLETPKTIYATT